MTTPPRRPTLAPVSREEFAALQNLVQQQADQAEQDRKVREDTHSMVQTLHNALLVPEPGHSLSLLDRMASATIDIESGQRVAHIVWKLFGFLTAAAGIVAFFYAAIRFGVSPRP